MNSKWELNLLRFEMKPNSHMVLGSFYQLHTNPQQLLKSPRKVLSQSLQIVLQNSLKMFQYFCLSILERSPYFFSLFPFHLVLYGNVSNHLFLNKIYVVCFMLWTQMFMCTAQKGQNSFCSDLFLQRIWRTLLRC